MNYMATTYTNGHKIFWDAEKRQWFYCDNRESSDIDRRCPKCREFPTADGHDACIANLPGIKFACCGHGLREQGKTDYGYLVFDDDTVIRDSDPNFDRILEDLLKKRDELRNKIQIIAYKYHILNNN